MVLEFVLGSSLKNLSISSLNCYMSSHVTIFFHGIFVKPIPNEDIDKFLRNNQNNLQWTNSETLSETKMKSYVNLIDYFC